MTKKFWFMAAISANLQGRPQVGFNLVTAIPTRNVGAAALNHIQEAGAAMVNRQAEPIPFDDLVIQNLMFLGEMTDDEFRAGVLTEEEAATADEAVAADVDLHPAGEVLKPRLELVADNAADTEAVTGVGTNNDLSNLDAQAVEATPVDDVTADEAREGPERVQGGGGVEGDSA
jgi:hypothetical protein